MVLRKAAKTAKLKLRKRQEDPWGKGVKVVKFQGFQSPEAHSDCKLTMKVEVGRLGAPAGGRRPFLTTVVAFLTVLCTQEKQLKLGLNSLGRAEDQPKLIKQESLQVRKAKNVDGLVRNSSFCS